MSNLFFENGDILQFKNVDFIVQQCNCLTIKSRGLAEAIAAAYPDADTYSKRRPNSKNLAIEEDRHIPGTISVHKKVINMYAQWRPGRVQGPHFSLYPESLETETTKSREKWFLQCLSAIASTFGNEPKRFAFPFKIGCGLAGGDWKVYLRMLQEFAEKNPHFTITIVKFEENEI